MTMGRPKKSKTALTTVQVAVPIETHKYLKEVKDALGLNSLGDTVTHVCSDIKSCDESQRELEAVKAELATTQAEIASAKAEATRFKSEKQAVERENSALSESIEFIKSGTKTLADQVEDLKQTNSRLKDELMSAQIRVMEFEANETLGKRLISFIDNLEAKEQQKKPLSRQSTAPAKDFSDVPTAELFTMNGKGVPQEKLTRSLLCVDYWNTINNDKPENQIYPTNSVLRQLTNCNGSVVSSWVNANESWIDSVAPVSKNDALVFNKNKTSAGLLDIIRGVLMNDEFKKGSTAPPKKPKDPNEKKSHCATSSGANSNSTTKKDISEELMNFDDAFKNLMSSNLQGAILSERDIMIDGFVQHIIQRIDRILMEIPSLTPINVGKRIHKLETEFPAKLRVLIKSRVADPAPATSRGYLSDVCNALLKHYGDLKPVAAFGEANFPLYIAETLRKSAFTAFGEERKSTRNHSEIVLATKARQMKQIAVAPMVIWANSILQNPQDADVYHLATAIAIVTGRRSGEVMLTGLFDYVDDNWILFGHHSKTRGDELPTSYKIPVLNGNAKLVCEAVNHLRHLVPPPEKAVNPTSNDDLREVLKDYNNSKLSRYWRDSVKDICFNELGLNESDYVVDIPTSAMLSDGQQQYKKDSLLKVKNLREIYAGALYEIRAFADKDLASYKGWQLRERFLGHSHQESQSYDSAFCVADGDELRAIHPVNTQK